MQKQFIQTGQFVRRTEAGTKHNRENWIGVITDIDESLELVSVLWLYKVSAYRSFISIEDEVQKSYDLDQNGAVFYSASFMASKRITDYPLIVNLNNLANLQRFSEATRERIRDHLGQPSIQQQQELPLETEQEKSPKQPVTGDGPKSFVVVESTSLKPMTRSDADKILRQAALQQPGKTFTLVQMIQHAKYPIDPIIVKAY